MLVFPTPKYRKRKTIRAQKTQPPAALTLTAATYEQGVSVRLTFDRAVDVSGLIGSEIVVDDGAFELIRYEATGNVNQVAPNIVEIELNAVGASSISDVRLDAGAGNGIVASDDGAEWAGVTGVPLPFP